MTIQENNQLIESDDFPFEFLSQLAERESWRKEVHRPIYHVHKWWAKRLGSIFRGILLGCALPTGRDLSREFYDTHAFSRTVVFDPFMGSGTTVGEAHKLGFTALGRDINPVAVDAARVAFGPLDRGKIEAAFQNLDDDVGVRIRALYSSVDSQSRPCDVLYHFWVMQADCPTCSRTLDLFPSWVIARNAYPERKPEVKILCPNCGDIFGGHHKETHVSCPVCLHKFDVNRAPAVGAKATCHSCDHSFPILKALGGRRPTFRLYGKLVLTQDSQKEYIQATDADFAAYRECGERLVGEIESGSINLPVLSLGDGFNTRQAMSYGFTSWRDFFNDRQLLALGWLHAATTDIDDPPTRGALLTLFSGALEFNNLFASYKGEGTGAVRHMFSHHVLKPERVPIEANVWGTPKSSGSFSGLFRSRILRALDYRAAPTEVNGIGKHKGKVCSPPFAGEVAPWPTSGDFLPRSISLSCGDSSFTNLPSKSIDLIVTDPPFFDNVHYSELADFFYAWQQLGNGGHGTTRNEAEVQDSDPARFADKLRAVFTECHRILKDEGLLAFTYHHSRDEGWEALAAALHSSGFKAVNSHPVKAEMSVATPKSQAKEPIQLDIIFVCRKATPQNVSGTLFAFDAAADAAGEKIERLRKAGFKLSRNDKKVVLLAQMITASGAVPALPTFAEAEFESALSKH